MPAYRGLRNESREFYVVFAPSRFRRLWTPFCKSAFRHCWLFWPSYIGTPGLMTKRITLKAEALTTTLDIDAWVEDPREVARQFLGLSTDIVRLTLHHKSKLDFTPRGIYTCVSMVKAVMNIKGWWIVKPEQLYRRLIKMGAVSLKEELKNESVSDTAGNDIRYHQPVQAKG